MATPSAIKMVSADLSRGYRSGLILMKVVNNQVTPNYILLTNKERNGQDRYNIVVIISAVKNNKVSATCNVIKGYEETPEPELLTTKIVDLLVETEYPIQLTFKDNDVLSLKLNFINTWMSDKI